ncbi:alpha/beta hydrolase [Streptomyces lonarensis]|uniref:Alpha/beta hydrolase n=1 Tax=Streptomyces lonarensis TaxID=700599 RepID=A0A7X6HYY9_9ACTN|nr:alpha/beta hydrolase [Streptomyces lonarensis]NJQ06103.1 alpha/beta hydrolase [Streptomyces lonarensis]
MRRPSTPLVAVTLVSALTLAGCSSSDGTDSEPVAADVADGGSPADGNGDSLDWTDCPEDVAVPGLECATLGVPLDHDDPDGEEIEIAVSRLAAEGDDRHGVLLLNGGGPGGQTLQMPAQLAELGVPQDVLDTYDVIGVDPRGVGHSTPVTCELELTDHPTNIPLHARDEDDVAAEAERVAAVAEKCGDSPTADLLPYITTANTARDLDRVREALGESTVSYFGISYGSYLGAVYTSLFPEQVDRVVLDSVTGPGGWDADFARSFAEGFEDRFPDFAAFAAAEHKTYGLGETPAEVEATYLDLGERLDAEPSPEGYTGQVFRQLTFDHLYYDEKFPQLAEVWQALDTGEEVPEPEVDPDVAAAAGGDIPSDNYLASQLHVICNDSDWPSDVETYTRNVASDREEFPLFGAAAANVTPCAFWPSEPVEEPVEITDRSEADILLLQNLRDPATPLTGAREMHEALGDRVRLVTADQGGHVAYLMQDNTCANDLVTEFLVTGERPDEDVACEAD